MVKSQEPLEVTQWMSRECRVLSLVLSTFDSLKVDLNMAAKPVKYSQKLIYIDFNGKFHKKYILSFRFGDTKWEKSIEHPFFLTTPHGIECCVNLFLVYITDVHSIRRRSWLMLWSELSQKRCKCSAKLVRRDVELFPYYIITTFRNHLHDFWQSMMDIERSDTIQY